MKTTLLCLLLLFTGLAKAQIINIPDANFKAKLLAANTTNSIAKNEANESIAVDVNGDGEIQETEAGLVFYLNIESSAVSDITGINSFSSLNILYANDNSITVADLHGLLNLRGIYITNNALNSITLYELPILFTVGLNGNQLTEIDLSNLPIVQEFTCFNNPSLSYLNLKNGGQDMIYPTVENGTQHSTDLQYVCADEEDVAATQDFLIRYYNLDQVTLTTYCSFTPGGDYNTITGTLRFDGNNDGCDAADATQSFIKVKIDDGTNTGYTFTNSAGQYTFYTQAGTFNVTAEFEDNQFFTALPSPAQVIFPAVDNSIATENFCVTANGMHPDVEVVMVPLTNARPGFDAIYKIVYKNKGNQVLTGRVSCGWDTSILYPIALDPFPDGMQPNTYTWDYANLQPFESREILMTLNVNSPTEVPAVNDGDVLPFTASVNSGYADETPDDNYYEFNQTVVNSLDPNNIVCVEGDTESPDAIGDYLHYIVNFENTGTAPAEFVVITHDIDPAEFDVNTVEILNASHDVKARISGNRIEFAFAGIQLGVAAHGNILFKLKSRASLQQGDIVVNRANIFFDYNSPLATNDARTVFALLSTGNFAKDASVQIYPNPAKNTVTVKADGIIQSVQLYDIQGRLLQTTVVNDTLQLLDISSRTSGLYFIKVTTDKGVSVEKVIRE